MASGLPVLAANAGAVKDLVVHQRSGILVEPGRADAFIREISLRANSSDQLRMMGLEGRKLAEQRSWQQIFDTLIEDYEEAIEKRQRRTKDRMITA